VTGLITFLTLQYLTAKTLEKKPGVMGVTEPLNELLRLLNNNPQDAEKFKTGLSRKAKQLASLTIVQQKPKLEAARSFESLDLTLIKNFIANRLHQQEYTEIINDRSQMFAVNHDLLLANIIQHQTRGNPLEIDINLLSDAQKPAFAPVQQNITAFLKLPNIEETTFLGKLQHYINTHKNLSHIENNYEQMLEPLSKAKALAHMIMKKATTNGRFDRTKLDKINTELQSSISILNRITEPTTT